MSKKSFPVGTQDYRELRMDNYYTIDKTMMIKEFLERKTKVTLITRPRRFGKTLNMSMLAEFFDITKDSKALFEGLAIMDTPYAKEMNQWPVIFISLADCKGSYDNLKQFLFVILRDLYARYEDILNSDKIRKSLRVVADDIYTILKKRSDFISISLAISTLSEVLTAYYNKKPMIFIDEYDTPFIEAHTHGYYDKVHDVLASLMRTTLKGNLYMQYAMITGIQRVAKENVFSDLNNLKVYTVYNKPYAQYFGFTVEETQAVLAYYDMPYSDEVKQMYNGYNIGGIKIYNPWSIMNYVQEKVLIAYWVNTSSNEMIKDALENADNDFSSKYEKLILEGSVRTVVNLETSFFEYKQSTSLWGFLVNAGYLTIVKEEEDDFCTLRIPNDEVKKEFKNLTAAYLHVSKDSLASIMNGLINQDKEMFITNYRSFLLSVVSSHDLVNENSYHMLLLGMFSFINKNFEIKSNRESGTGRYDLVISAKIPKYASYVFELKYTKDKNENLHELANEAIKQIETKKYDYELTGNIIHIGLAHCGKNVEMIWKQK